MPITKKSNIDFILFYFRLMEQKEVAFTVGDNSPSHLGDEDSYRSKDSNPTKVPAKAI